MASGVQQGAPRARVLWYNTSVPGFGHGNSKLPVVDESVRGSKVFVGFDVSPSRVIVADTWEDAWEVFIDQLPTCDLTMDEEDQIERGESVDGVEWSSDGRPVCTIYAMLHEVPLDAVCWLAS